MTSTELSYFTNNDGSRGNSNLYAPPAPSVAGTACLLAGIAFAYSQYPTEETATLMATVAARVVGIAFAASILFDCQRGLRNLLRTDLLCIFGIYGLTLAEFLFPQDDFEGMTNPEQTALAISITLIGLAAMAIGRHFTVSRPMSSKIGRAHV